MITDHVKVLRRGSPTAGHSGRMQGAVAQGLDAETAHGYVTALFRGLAEEAAVTAAAAFPSLVTDHETPGGLNEQVRLALQQMGAFEELATQLSDLLRTRYAPSGASLARERNRAAGSAGLVSP